MYRENWIETLRYGFMAFCHKQLRVLDIKNKNSNKLVSVCQIEKLNTDFLKVMGEKKRI